MHRATRSPKTALVQSTIFKMRIACHITKMYERFPLKYCNFLSGVAFNDDFNGNQIATLVLLVVGIPTKKWAK